MSHARNGHGSATAWAGTWGIPADGRSKVSRLRKGIRADLEKEYGPFTSPVITRLADDVALLWALAVMTSDTMGTSGKATLGAYRKLTRAVDAKLAVLAAASSRTDRTPRSAADLLALRREAGG